MILEILKYPDKRLRTIASPVQEVNSEIKKQEIEPVAFGLEALILTIQTPDEEGIVDNVEENIGAIEEVVNVTVISASRLSSKLP